MKKKILMALFTLIIICLLAISVSAANEVTLTGGNKANIETVFKIGTSNGVENVITGFNDGYSKDMITDVVFPDQIAGIEANNLFKSATSIKTITFGATDTFFISGDSIFSSCSVEKITFNPNCVVELRKGNFSSCKSLTEITFPKFKALAGSAFRNNSSMKATNDLVFVEGMTEIGGHAFNGCILLTCKVYFPASLVTIQEYSFQQTGISSYDLSKCANLTKVGGEFGGPFTNNDSLITLDLSGCTSLKILGGTKDGGFASGCDNLTNVILPPNLETVHKGAFSKCYKLQSIVLPASVKEVGSEAFHSARKDQTIKTLTIYVQSDVVFHDSYAFRDSSAKIEFVLVGDKVTKESFVSANTHSAITGATVVDYLADSNKWTYVPGQTISNHTIVENYCKSLGLTKSHSATDAICDNTDLCLDCGYTTCTPHTGAMSIAYPNGYAANGEKKNCSLAICGGSKSIEIKPIFVTKGYSIKEVDGYGITATYTINDKELEEYETLNGKLTFGVIMANANFDGQSSFMSKDENGEYKLNTSRGIKAEMQERGYSRLDMRVDSFTQNEATLNLVMALYVVDGNGISYIQHDGEYAGKVIKDDATLDVVTIVKIAEIVNVQLPFIVPTQASEIKENL